MGTASELLDAAIAKLRTANRIDGNRNSFKKDSPGEYASVEAYFTGGPRPTVSSDMGQGLVGVEDARRAIANPPEPIPPEPTPVPPTGDKLKWAPPQLSSPTTITITNANCRPSLDTAKDYIVKITERITADGGVMLNGGRNIVVIGGEIYNDNLHTPPFDMWRQIGLYLPNVKGTAHVEGVYIHGRGIGDGLQTGTGASSATIQVQNCRIVCEHITQKTGAHPDGLQCYAGPSHWKMDRDTIISGGTIRTWQPMNYGGTIKTVDIRRQNWVAQQSKVEYGTYSIWDDLPSGTAWWSEYHEDLWFWTDSTHDSFHGLHRNGDAPNGFTPGQYGITGEATKWGKRPEGDWVPATLAGMGYVSPGYQ